MSSYICGICNKKLPTRFLRFENVRYHYECFVCAKCGTPLKDEFYEKGGKIYCKKDLPKGPAPDTSSSSMTSAPPGAYTYTGEDGEEAPPPPPDEDDDDASSEKKCLVCQGKMNVDSWIVIDTEVVHRKCFFCSACGMALHGVPYFLSNGALVCEHDYKWAKGDDDRSWMCSGCHKVIQEDLVNALGKKWHTECLKCSKPGCKMGAKYLHTEKGKDILYCTTHIPEGSMLEVQEKKLPPEEEVVISQDDDYEDLPLPSAGSTLPKASTASVSPYKSSAPSSAYSSSSSASPYKSGGGSNPYKSQPKKEEPSGPPASSYFAPDDDDNGIGLPPPPPEDDEDAPPPSFDPPAEPDEPEPEPEPEPEVKTKAKSGGSSKAKAKADVSEASDVSGLTVGQDGTIIDTRKLDSAKKQMASHQAAKAKLKEQLGDDAPKYKKSYKVPASKFEEENSKTGKPKSKK